MGKFKEVEARVDQLGRSGAERGRGGGRHYQKIKKKAGTARYRPIIISALLKQVFKSTLSQRASHHSSLIFLSVKSGHFRPSG